MLRQGRAKEKKQNTRASCVNIEIWGAPGSGRIYHHRIVCWVEKPNVSNASLYQSLAEIRIGSNSDCNGLPPCTSPARISQAQCPSRPVPLATAHECLYSRHMQIPLLFFPLLPFFPFPLFVSAAILSLVFLILDKLPSFFETRDLCCELVVALEVLRIRVVCLALAGF